MSMESDLYSRLGSIEAKVDMLLAEKSATMKMFEAQDARISKIERWQGKTAGAIALGSFLVGLLPSIIRLLL